jgi:hypothetical protein
MNTRDDLDADMMKLPVLGIAQTLPVCTSAANMRNLSIPRKNGATTGSESDLVVLKFSLQSIRMALAAAFDPLLDIM